MSSTVDEGKTTTATTSTTRSTNTTVLQRVGCVGGGQLGRMMGLEAPRLFAGLSMTFLDPTGAQCPAAACTPNEVVEGRLDDAEALAELASRVDVVTVEIEHVGVEGLEALERQGTKVRPSAGVLRTIRDKLVQKTHFQNAGVPVAPFMGCGGSGSGRDRGRSENATVADAVRESVAVLGVPLMLKRRRGGYDGRGNAVVKDDSMETIQKALKSLGVDPSSSATEPSDEANADANATYAEAWVDYACEVAVMVVRDVRGTTLSYPPVSAVQAHSVCRAVVAPAQDLSAATRTECERVARAAIDSLGEGAVGVFGVELFVVDKKNKYTTHNFPDENEDGYSKVYLNEVAPRPHNTGHYTQDACTTSQFENHLRAVCGMELGDCSMKVGAAAMVNVLGAPSGAMEDTLATNRAAMSLPNASVHWYGKKQCRSGRKMGHVNLTAPSVAELQSSFQTLWELQQPKPLPPVFASSNKPPKVLVGIVMGSQSDLPTMQAAARILRGPPFYIPTEVDIVSAHRTPDKLVSYARTAADRGLEVIIAGAGGAAHLPGMLASMTPLPVVGVPIKTSTLNGQDSLLSIVQMPRGIPVATVAIGNATNAGLLAVRILASTRPHLRDAMVRYQEGLRDAVMETSARLVDQGSEAYLEAMDNKNTSVNV